MPLYTAMKEADEWLDLKYREDDLLRQAEELKVQRKTVEKVLSTKLSDGDEYTYKGRRHKWTLVEQVRVGWKGLYEQAYALLDDEGQVIVGDVKDRAGKVTKYHTFKADK